MNTQTATEYRNLPLALLTPSKTNPRRVMEDEALLELARVSAFTVSSNPSLFALLPSVNLKSSPEDDDS